MKTMKITLYMALMFFTTGVANAAPASMENPVSTAMLVYIPTALLAILITYFIWRKNILKRRENPPKVVNRGPVRRPMIAYHRRKALS